MSVVIVKYVDYMADWKYFPEVSVLGLLKQKADVTIWLCQKKF